MLRYLLSALVPALILATTVAVPQASMAAEPSATLRDLQNLGLEISWRNQGVLDRSRDQLRYLSNDEDVVIMQSSAGMVSAFNAEIGRRLWVRQLGRNDEFATRVSTNSNTAVVLAGPVAWGVDKFTGEHLFEYRLPRPASATPVLVEGACYVPLAGGTVFGFALTTLKHIDRYDTLPPGVAHPYLWRFRCKERIIQPLVSANDVISFATESENLHCISPAGISHYQILLNARPSAPMALDADGERPAVILATTDGSLYSFDQTRGTLLWTVPLERRVTQKPLLVGKRVYIITEATGLNCISTATGNYVQIPAEDESSSDATWFVPGIKAIAAVTAERVYAIDTSGRLVAIRTEDAQVMARVPMRKYSVYLQNASTDRVVLASESGELVSLKPIGSDFALYHRRPDKQPLAVEVPADESDEQ